MSGSYLATAESRSLIESGQVSSSVSMPWCHGMPHALASWMMMSTSNQLSPSGSTVLQWQPSWPPEPCEVRGQSTSSQWRTGSRMSASCEVGVCHRSRSRKKSSCLRPSHAHSAFDMFMTSPDWQMPM